MTDVAYLVFDIETAADGELIQRVLYPDSELSPDDAVDRYREELKARSGSDCLPPTFVRPVAVCVAKVRSDYRLIDVVAVDEPKYRPHKLVDGFWRGWKHYGQPVLVTYNGRSYDIPVLELAAFRDGLALPEWFNLEARSYEQNRHRYNLDAHIDLMDLLANFGASRVDGGLNLLSHVLGKPGQSSINGNEVQGYVREGRLDEINDYCRHDVLDTYFVFLRSRVLLGKITLDQEQDIVEDARLWLTERSESDLPGAEAFASYLESWGKWLPPEM